MGNLVFILGCEAPLGDSGGTRECLCSFLGMDIIWNTSWDYYVFKFISGFLDFTRFWNMVLGIDMRYLSLLLIHPR